MTGNSCFPMYYFPNARTLHFPPHNPLQEKTEYNLLEEETEETTAYLESNPSPSRSSDTIAARTSSRKASRRRLNSAAGPHPSVSVAFPVVTVWPVHTGAGGVAGSVQNTCGEIACVWVRVSSEGVGVVR